MKTLNLLIKIKQKEIDEQKSQLSLLQNEFNQIQDTISLMTSGLEKQETFIENHPEYSFSYNNYFSNYKNAVDMMRKRQKILTDKIDKYNDIIFNLFSELKKFEIARDDKLEEIKHMEKTIEDKNFDEIGIAIYNKKK